MSTGRLSNQVPHFENSNIGILNSQALPEGLTPIYVQGQLYKIKDKKQSELRIACAISFLNQSGIEAEQITDLKEKKRMGVIHVEKGKIKSLTLCKDQLEMMQANGVNEIAFKVKETVLIIKDQMIVRQFTSEAEYQNFTEKLNRA